MGSLHFSTHPRINSPAADDHLPPVARLIAAIALQGFVVIAAGAHLAGATGLASPFFLITLYFLHTCGELLVSPVGLSFVTKVAPIKIASMMMGVWFLCNFTANLVGGYIAGTVQKVARGEVFTLLGGQADFFLIFVLTSFAACALLVILTPMLNRLIHGKG